MNNERLRLGTLKIDKVSRKICNDMINNQTINIINNILTNVLFKESNNLYHIIEANLFILEILKIELDYTPYKASLCKYIECDEYSLKFIKTLSNSLYDYIVIFYIGDGTYFSFKENDLI